MKQQIAALIAMALLAGCAGFDTVAQRPGTTRPSGTQAKAEGRTLSFKVNAPAGLASGDRIVNSNVSGIIAAGGGNIIAAGGGNIIAAGGGNIIAAGGGNYRVQAASTETFRPVDSAVFHVENAQGRISEFFKTIDDGTIQIKNVPDGELLYVVARFEVEGQVYRVSTPVPTGPIENQWFVDPINTMIMAKLKAGAADGKRATMALAQLAEIWGICNDAGVGVPVDALAADKKWTDLKAFYEGLVPQIEEAETAGTVKAGSKAKLEAFLLDLDS